MFLWPLFTYFLLNIFCHLGSKILCSVFPVAVSNHFTFSNGKQSCHLYIKVATLFLSLLSQIYLEVYILS